MRAIEVVTDQTRFDEMQWPWWRPNLASSPPSGFSEGAVESVRERRLASLAFHVNPGDPPTFLTHGGQDQWVPPEQSELLADRLEEEGVPHRLIELPGARHAFDAAWGGWSQQIVRHELEEFLEHRLSDEDQDAR